MSGRATAATLALHGVVGRQAGRAALDEAGSQDDGMAHYLNLARAQPVASAAIAVAVIGLATILGAYFFQYVLGLPPCPLCLEQRVAYYISIPLAALILLGVSVGSSRKVAILALVVIAGFMLWNAGLGVYHSGVEWGWWQGPQDCSGPLTDIGSRGGLLEQLQNVRVVRCDEAAWRFLGLSLAGYNALISLALAAIALGGAAAAWKTRDIEDAGR
jgi:disulfide bond formation protein DsbB